MFYIRARRWRRPVGMAVGACLVIGSITVGTAVAEPKLPGDGVAPVSDSLTGLLVGESASAPVRVMVHGTDLAAANWAVSETGMTKLTEFRKVDVVVARATPQQVEQARSQPGVIYLEGDQPVELFTDTSHEATRGAQAARDLTGANGTSLDGSGVSVAVINTGIDPNHPSLSDGKVVNNLVCGPLEMMGCIAVGNTTLSDLTLHGHGTSVSAVAVGKPVALSDGRRISGAATGAKLVSLSIATILVGPDGGPQISFIGGNTALNWVLENHKEPCGSDASSKECPPIKVTNNSYGPPGGGDFDPMSATAKLQRALVDEGVMTVWANGNDGTANNPLDLDADDGTANDSNPPGQDPTPGIVSVASHFDQNHAVRDDPARPNVSDFSSRGLASDASTWPDISAPGEQILTACRPFFPQTCAPPGPELGNFKEVNGTSFAAPHITGIIAQLFQLNPHANPADVEDALKRTAFKYDDGEPVPYVPVGEYTSSFDKGTGLVDVLRAAEVLDPKKSRDHKKSHDPKWYNSEKSRDHEPVRPAPAASDDLASVVPDADGPGEGGAKRTQTPDPKEGDLVPNDLPAGRVPDLSRT